MRGADFLVARGLDKILERLIESIYDKKYKVNYIEKISEETNKIIKQRRTQLEKMAIEHVASEIDFENLNKPKQKNDNENQKSKTSVGVGVPDDPQKERRIKWKT